MSAIEDTTMQGTFGKRASLEASGSSTSSSNVRVADGTTCYYKLTVVVDGELQNFIKADVREMYQRYHNDPVIFVKKNYIGRNLASQLISA